MALTPSSVVIALNKPMPSLTEAVCKLQSIEYIEEIILIGPHDLISAEQDFHYNEKTRFIWVNEGTERGESIKLGVGQCTQPVTVLLNTWCQDFIQRLESALNQLDEYELLVGVPTSTNGHWNTRPVTRLQYRLVSFLTGLKGRALSPTFVVLRTSAIIRSQRALPDNSLFFPVLLLIMHRKRAKIDYVDHAVSRSDTRSIVTVSSSGLFKLMYWGIFLNPKKVLIPLGLISIIFGGLALAQSLGSDHKLSGYGLFTMTIGIGCVALTIVSQLLAEEILKS